MIATPLILAAFAAVTVELGPCAPDGVDPRVLRRALEVELAGTETSTAAVLKVHLQFDCDGKTATIALIDPRSAHRQEATISVADLRAGSKPRALALVIAERVRTMRDPAAPSEEMAAIVASASVAPPAVDVVPGTVPRESVAVIAAGWDSRSKTGWHEPPPRARPREDPPRASPPPSEGWLALGAAFSCRILPAPGHAFLGASASFELVPASSMPLSLSTRATYETASAEDPLGSGRLSVLTGGAGVSYFVSSTHARLALGPRIDLGWARAIGSAKPGASEAVADLFVIISSLGAEARVELSDRFAGTIGLDVGTVVRGVQARADERNVVALEGTIIALRAGLSLKN